MKWDIEDDKFVWEVLDKFMSVFFKKLVIRCGIVFVVYFLFDLFGFIVLYIMKVKLLFQMLIRKKIGWDELFEENEIVQWLRWLDDFSKFEEVKIDCCFRFKGFVKV